MKESFIYLLFVFFNVVLVSGQEYIADTCFDYAIVPKSGSPAFNYVSKFWRNPTKATPDLFFSGNPSPHLRIPKNYTGNKHPIGNTAYVGIVAITKDIKHAGPNWREYISVKLKNKLSSGKLYCLTLMVSLADTCNYAADGLEAYFSMKKLKSNATTNLPYDPQIKNIGGKIITNKKDWTRICSVFQATGGEEYLTIGNFKDDTHTLITPVKDKIRKNDFVAEMAYYYIGYVSLKPINSEEECNCNEQIISKDTTIKMVTQVDTFSAKQPAFILKDINFEIDKYDLLPEAYPQLDSIYNILNSKTGLIEINGYTDNTGSETYNIFLSKARAQSVADYFIARGISISRMIINGFGSINPIASNSTDEGRKKNRRVEIIIIK